MKELRRLFVQQQRIINSRRKNFSLDLIREETHYLNRVLRLRKGDCLNVIDGEGHLWEAAIERSNLLQLKSTFENPLIQVLRPQLRICLAVVVPKQGFDEFLRMGCEMGVDVFQPLTSEYRVQKGNDELRMNRWHNILKEAVEQSERLWMPELYSNIQIQDWLSSQTEVPIAIATTRESNSIDFQSWLETCNKKNNQIWTLIGPEGGWSPFELDLAAQTGCVQTNLGDNILRTSTAALAASQLLVAWRRSNPFD